VNYGTLKAISVHEIQYRRGHKLLDLGVSGDADCRRLLSRGEGIAPKTAFVAFFKILPETTWLPEDTRCSDMGAKTI